MAPKRPAIGERMAAYPRQRLDRSRRTGLILCGMGGPDGPEAVEPFLRNLFRDPEIFPVPPVLAPAIGWLIARRRAPAVKLRYARISKRSITPQIGTTRRQGEILARGLTEAGLSADSDIAMRYWRPFPAAAVDRLRAGGAEQYLVLPMYPQYSAATNGSTIDFVLAELVKQVPGAAVHVIADWHLLPGFLDALAAPAAAQVVAWASAGIPAHECALVYVAHSLPESFIRRGDPYLERTQATVAAVHARVTDVAAAAGCAAWLAALPTGGPEPALTFQSRVGPIRWLGPQIEQEVPRLAAAGCRNLFVQPVSFTCEHIETLLELDIELKETAQRSGVVAFARGAALNLNDTWLASLTAHLEAAAFERKD